MGLSTFATTSPFLLPLHRHVDVERNDSQPAGTTLLAPATPAGARTPGRTRVIVTPHVTPTTRRGTQAVVEPPPPFVGPVIANDASPAQKERFVIPTKDPARNKKCRRTTYVIDRDDKSSTDRNILLPLESLISFLETSFVASDAINGLFAAPRNNPSLH
jgi:hypothetical protein